MISLVARNLGLKEYSATWHAMQAFTRSRDESTLDEIWLVEHPAIFTQGQNGKPEHILDAGPIPVLKVDRGGQVTYHGPGQLLVYTLIDLQRKKWNVRQMVCLLEQSIMQFLKEFDLQAEQIDHAPGVYIDKKKICSIGLRIRRGCSFHGLALNINMDLSPFLRIHPCGFKTLQMTQLSEYCSIEINQILQKLLEYLTRHLGYTEYRLKTEEWYDNNQ